MCKELISIANDFLSRAKSFTDEEDHLTHYVNASLAAEIFKMHFDWYKYIECLVAKADIIYISFPEKKSKAIDIYYHALAILHQLEIKNPSRQSEAKFIYFYIQLYSAIGAIHTDTLNYKEALLCLQEAQKIAHQHKAIANQQHCIALEINLANVYRKKRSFPNALTYYQKALDLLNNNLKKYDFLSDKTTEEQFEHTEEYLEYLRLKATIHKHKGSLYFQIGSFDRAIDHYESAINLYELFPNPQTIKIARTLHNVGITLNKQQQYHKALAYLKKAQEAFVTTNQIVRQVRTLNAIASCYGNLGNYQQQIDTLTKALQLSNTSKQIDLNLEIARIHNNLGLCYLKIKLTISAFEHLEKALYIRQKELKTAHKDIIYSYNGLAMYYQQNQDYNRSLDYSQDALIAQINDFYNSDPKYNPEVELASDPLLINTLKIKAETYYAYYNTRPNKISLLYQALECWKLTISQIQKWHKQCRTHTVKSEYSDHYATCFISALQVAFELYQKTNDPKYFKEALAISEISKSSTLLETFNELDARKLSQIPSYLITKENQIERQLTACEKELFQASLQKDNKNKQLLAEIKTRTNQYKERYLSLIDYIAQHYPKYYQLKYNIKSNSLEEIQAGLNKQTALLQFHLHEDVIFVFVITQTQSHFIKYAIDLSTLKENINELRSSIPFGDDNLDFGLCNTLYQMVLAPVESLIFNRTQDGSISPRYQKLIIVPDDILYLLPFDILTINTSTVALSGAKRYPFLIKHFALAYQYSSSLWLQTKQKYQQQIKTLSDNFLGFAPVDFKDHQSSQPSSFSGLGQQIRSELTAHNDGKLPFSYEEVNKIDQLFQKAGLASECLTYGAANKQNLLSKIGHFKYILISTHGQFNRKCPDFNFFLTAPKPNADNEAALFYIEEAFTLELNATLVVLSCCDSGLGSLSKQEGMMAFNRGFLYAGASNIVFALSKIPDNANNSRLMQYLFEEIILHQQIDYAVALRSAKLRLIEEQVDLESFSWALLGIIGC